MWGFLSFFSPKNLLLIFGFGTAAVVATAGIGYYQIYNDRVTKLNLPKDAKFVYEFPKKGAEELEPGQIIVGNSSPDTKVEVVLQPKDNIKKEPVTAEVLSNDLGYWIYSIPENIDTGSYVLRVVPKNEGKVNEDDTNDFEIIIDDSDNEASESGLVDEPPIEEDSENGTLVRETPLPTMTSNPSPVATPIPDYCEGFWESVTSFLGIADCIKQETTPSPTPVAVSSSTPVPTTGPLCNDNQIYCQDNVKIWKHEGLWEGDKCTYKYEEMGSCDEPTAVATAKPTPTATPVPTPIPTSTPDPNCSGETYYCSVNFLIREDKRWEGDRCVTSTESVKDSKGKKVKCSCGDLIPWGVCNLSNSKSSQK